jgi:hypothetical protein
MQLRRNAVVGTALCTILCIMARSSGDARTTDAPRDVPTASVITDTTELLEGPAAGGTLGDVLMENGRVAFIVSAPAHEPPGAQSGGHVIDAALIPSGADLLSHIVATPGAWPRQAVYDSIRITGDAAEAIVVVAGSDSDVPGCRVATRYRLAAGAPSLLVETVFRNESDASIDLAAGDAVGWGEADNFVPGYGFDLTGLSTFYDEWIGAAGATSYGYCMVQGAMSCAHGVDWTDTRTSQKTLAPGDSTVLRRHLTVGRDLAGATDGVHAARGTTVGALSGSAVSEDTGLPLEGATLDLLVNGLAPYTQVVLGADGSVGCTLPPASYKLEASAPAYYGDELILAVAAGGTTDVHLSLRPVGWNTDKGDTLTYVMRPILSVPAITTPGETFTIEAMAPTSTTGWEVSLRGEASAAPLSIDDVSYDATRGLWLLEAGVPSGTPVGMHDLVLTASGGIADTVANAVSVRGGPDDEFYVVHITDTHLPTHNFSSDGEESLADSSEMVDLREVIRDINTINPAFVILTGDLVNEGELEDYFDARVFTRAKRLLATLEVPVYLVPGNHDIGGWSSTPPSDGTARRDWWRFFGWRYLGNPPGGSGRRTQDYSFDFGGVHFVGLETYDNYDRWREEIYGAYSMTDDQYDWLLADLSAAGTATPTVLFYHYDFGDQIDLGALGAECALWGHIHWSSGSITNPPYNISTGTVCDGRRLMRLLRFSNGAVIPSNTISAGAQGLLLTTTFDGPNDGTMSGLTAEVSNGTSERFEHAAVRFELAAEGAPYAAEGGTLVQTVLDGSSARCLITLDVPAHGSATCSVVHDTTTATPHSLALRQSCPNPARSGVTLEFVLASRANAELAIYDVAGRLVAVPWSGEAAEGPNEVTWNLRDTAGRAVASGVYFYRLSAAGTTITRKLVVLR